MLYELTALRCKEMGIMFKITEGEYDEMIAAISKCCCFKPHPCSYCSEIDCDVHMISAILRSHLENNYIKPDGEEFDKDLIAKEFGIDLDDDSLPFRE